MFFQQINKHLKMDDEHYIKTNDAKNCSKRNMNFES